jgi:hypothetical protein
MVHCSLDPIRLHAKLAPYPCVCSNDARATEGWRESVDGGVGPTGKPQSSSAASGEGPVTAASPLSTAPPGCFSGGPGPGYPIASDDGGLLVERLLASSSPERLLALATALGELQSAGVPES